MTAFERAARKFKDFHGREPKRGDIAIVRERGKMALVIGELDGVMYKVKGERKSTLHRFNKNDRPLLLVSFDGRQLYILKGGYGFTERGIIG